ncbi:MAG TPA: Shedu anti-phage system protein SduA domain-containing protein [Thermoanaerobaculia bacterium]|nr:Shedu anti-phage system protein SduA domain-containing protein [Thermoanaerobaculia bacterium]
MKKRTEHPLGPASQFGYGMEGEYLRHQERLCRESALKQKLESGVRDNELEGVDKRLLDHNDSLQRYSQEIKLYDERKAIGGSHFLRKMEQARVEPDQKLRRALELASSRDTTDANIFLALYRQNCISTRLLPLDLTRLKTIRNHPQLYEYRLNKRVPLPSMTVRRQPSIDALMWSLKAGEANKTLSSKKFLRELLRYCVKRGDNVLGKPYTAGLIAELTGYAFHDRFSDLPVYRDLSEALERPWEDDGAEDYQFALFSIEDRLYLRPVSVLGDYIQHHGEITRPHRALLTHFQGHFGGFSQVEIEQLDSLINSPSASELDFQRFFEAHSHFLRLWDHREVYPHVILRGDSDSAMIPDFILTDKALQRAAVLELKLPGPKLVRRQTNRDRFSALVMEARVQLIRYRNWFRSRTNRRSLVSQVGMEIYEPQMIVVIGRSSEFVDDFDRQEISSMVRDVQIVTYDDLVTFAARRVALLDV